ncbi:MAG: hypothetical protein JXX14_01015 [Deltaproteobacteria bacterium]|nr:hypothetical protein [Deltaproteobacteria bacterium]
MTKNSFALFVAACLVLAFVEPQNSIAGDQKSPSGTSAAQTDNRDETARKAFQKARELFEAEQFEAAAIQFRIAYKNKPSWKLLYNIAQCEVGAKRYGAGLEHFEQYLVEAGDKITYERRREVEDETVRLRNMVGYLEVTGPEGADLFVGGIKRGTLPLKGMLAITASQEQVVSGIVDGRKLSVKRLKVMIGQKQTVELGELESNEASAESAPVVSRPAATAPPSPHAQDAAPENTVASNESVESPEPAAPEETPEESAELETVPEPISQAADDMNIGPEPAVEEMAVTNEQDAASTESGSRLKKVGMGLAIGGGAVFAGGFILGGTGLLKLKKLDEDNPKGVDGADAKARDRYKSMSMAGDVMMVVGGLAAATGVALLIVNRKKSESLQASIVPVFGGLGIQGSF